MTATGTHRDLVVWQKAMELVDLAYLFARKLPDSERYGLYSQITCAVVSVPANIAEGHGRSGPREFANFVSIARGSLSELETLIEVARRQGFIDDDNASACFVCAESVGRMLTVLGNRLRAAGR